MSEKKQSKKKQDVNVLANDFGEMSDEISNEIMALSKKMSKKYGICGEVCLFSIKVNSTKLADEFLLFQKEVLS